MWRKQRGSTKSDSAGGHRGHPFTPPLPEPEEEGTPPPQAGLGPSQGHPPGKASGESVVPRL